VASKFSCPPSRGQRPGSPPVMKPPRTPGRAGWWCGPCDPPAWHRYLPAGADRPSAIPERSTVVPCWWCSGIALAWKGRHARRRWRGGRPGSRRGVAPVRWLAGGGQCCRGLSLRGRCRRLAEAGRVGGHAGAGSAPAVRQW
jgi:hypothetical protein